MRIRRTSLTIVSALALLGAPAPGCSSATRSPGDDGGPGGGDGGLRPDADARPDGAPDADQVLPPDDAGPPGECGRDMVRVPGLPACIDRFEASRGDDDTPHSVSGAMPWNHVSHDEASAACELAGKRLCTAEEWLSACGGEEGHEFPYGDFFHAGRCNDQASPAGAPIPAGALEGCEGGVEGLFDMSGNVAEWLVTPSLVGDGGLYYEPVGGSFDSAAGCVHSTNGGYDPSSGRAATIGFRCCRAL